MNDAKAHPICCVRQGAQSGIERDAVRQSEDNANDEQYVEGAALGLTPASSMIGYRHWWQLIRSDQHLVHALNGHCRPRDGGREAALAPSPQAIVCSHKLTCRLSYTQTLEVYTRKPS